MRRRSGWVILFLGLLGVSASARAAKEATRTVEVLSKVYTIDRKYPSMKGPQSTQSFWPADRKTPELLWITGYRAVVVGPKDTAPVSQEFMCHSNLDYYDAGRHNVLFGRNVSNRLFTLSQGEVSVDFPKGFGIPILSTEALSLTTQVLNHNIENETFHVRHKVEVEYVRDRDLKAPFKPLFTRGAYGLALLKGRDGYYGIDKPDETVHEADCLPGQNADQHIYHDTFAREFTGHWVVKPGREVRRTLATRLMDLPFDCTVHYIAVHLHPFAESLELRDLTTGKSLFKSRARGFKDKIGISRVDRYSSQRGIPVFKDHDYEIVSVYNNTTGVDQDAMAVMYLYLLDREFRRPAPEALK